MGAAVIKGFVNLSLFWTVGGGGVVDKSICISISNHGS